MSLFSKNEPELRAALKISRQLNKILSMFNTVSFAFLAMFIFPFAIPNFYSNHFE